MLADIGEGPVRGFPERHGGLVGAVRGGAGRAAAGSDAASDTIRQMRWTKRWAPATPSSVQITSRSGGESDSMNQRAVSAP